MRARATDPMEFAISPVIPNRPVPAEIDPVRQRELRRWLLAGVVLLGGLIFDGWQRYGIISHGFQLETVQTERAIEEQKSRQLRLDIESLRAPARIELKATAELHLVAPGPRDAIVIERVVPAEAPPSSVVATR